MPTDSAVVHGFQEQRVIRAKLAASETGAIRRAVSDVLDGTLGFIAAHKAHGVGEHTLREALLVAGWVPPSQRQKPKAARRRTFGSGKRHGT